MKRNKKSAKGAQQSELEKMQSIKPRNHHIVAMVQRKSGAHEQSFKARRAQDKQALIKAVRESEGRLAHYLKQLIIVLNSALTKQGFA